MSTSNNATDEVDSPDIHFEPIIQLAPVEVVTMEEDEEELLQLRAKLFRFDNEMEPPEWKERGTGYVKILKHKKSQLCRILMRRDKTLKICANHYVQPQMELKPNCGSDRAWVWTTISDFSDDEPKPELLAIRFANAENAQKFKATFDKAKDVMKEAVPKHNTALQTNGEVESLDKSVSEETEDETKDKVSEKAAGGDSIEDKTTSQTSTESNTSNTDTDTVAAKLENLTVKEQTDSQDSTGANQTDDNKIENKEETVTEKTD